MKDNKKSLLTPIVALLLECVPFALLYSGFFGSLILLLLLICPIIGLILGVSSLRKGKKTIGLSGMVLSALAVIFPAGLICFILYFFIGITTGLIPLM